MLRIGLIGCGHWGKNYFRVFNELSNSQIVWVSDARPEVAQGINKYKSTIEFSTDFETFLKKNFADAIVVSTPASTHYEIAKKCLLNGVHILIEKPLALKVEEAIELAELAEKKKKNLMVGHTFLFNLGIRKIKEYIGNPDFGKIYYIHSNRTHIGLIRDDVNAVWDLAPHDVAIFSYLLDANPIKVSAVGGTFLKDSKEDVGFINLIYSNGIIGNIHVSWINSNKVRELAVIGSKKRILFDDLNNLEKIRIFEKGVSVERPYDGFGEFQLLLRDGDIISPKVEPHEPLKIQCAHFLECIEKNQIPLTNGRHAVNNVRVMVAIQKSMEREGEPVNV